jgi:hypothetical protein
VQVRRVFEHVTTIVRNRRGKYSENMDKRELVELRVCAIPSAVYTNFSNEVYAYGTVANKYGVIVVEAGK